MDYSRPERSDRLAAEYVLGTLHGRARRRFEALLPAHPALRQATADWERRLAQLAIATPAVTPSARVWQGIQQRLFAAGQAAAPAGVERIVRWWQRLALWQGAAGFATVTALALGLLLAQPQPVQPPVVVVMAAQVVEPGKGIQPAAFVASVSGDGRSLVLKPVDEKLQVAVNKSLELWAVPPKGAPRSLGLVSAHGSTTVVRSSLLQNTAAFAITVEPPGGAPGGVATGPAISVGKLQL